MVQDTPAADGCHPAIGAGRQADDLAELAGEAVAVREAGVDGDLRVGRYSRCDRLFHAVFPWQAQDKQAPA